MAHSLGKISGSMESPSFSVFLPRDAGLNLITFPDLPTQFHVDLSYILDCISVFLPVSNSFSVILSPHLDVFFMFTGEVNSMSS